MGAGFGTLQGCTSPWEPRANAQTVLQGNEEATNQTASVLLNHKQSPMYQQMLRQGNYSDAAIFEKLDMKFIYFDLLFQLSGEIWHNRAE